MSAAYFHDEPQGAEPAREIAALTDRLKSLAAWRLVKGDIMATADTGVLNEAVARLVFMEDESDRLHDDVARLLRERNTLAQDCVELANWQRRAAAELREALDRYEDGRASLTAEQVTRLETLLADEYSEPESAEL